MAVSDREMLEQLRAEQGNLSEREKLELLRALQGPLDEADTGRRDNLVESFNRGLIDLINAPINLFNFAGEFGPRIGGEDERFRIPGTEELETLATKVDLVADERGEGFASRTAEILGASVVPVGGILAKGGQILQTAGQVVKRPQSILAQAAKSPKITLAGETVASAAAATGGEVAKRFSDDPVVIALGEISGGLTPLGAIKAVTSGVPARIARKAGDVAVKSVLPFTKKGAEPRAARRLQSLATDPEAAAAAVTTGKPGISPARRTGDRRLLALEKEVLSLDPAAEARFSDNLKIALQAAREEALQFGGDTNRPRELLRRGNDYLTRIVQVRAAQAAARAQAKIDNLGPDATPREISVIARKQMDSALTTARADEKRIWASLDQTKKTNFSNSRSELQDIIVGRSRKDNPADIPKWLISKEAGVFDPDTPKAPILFKDVQAVRSRVLAEIRAERVKPAPNRRKIGILGTVQKALLLDLKAANVPGAEDALAFSNKLNTLFSEGEIGDLLGNTIKSGLTAPEDSLQKIVSGTQGATRLRKFLAAAPESKTTVENFVKARYLEQVVQPKGFDKASHNQFIRQHRKSGIFEELPNLEGELLNAGDLSTAAARLGLRADKVAAIIRSPARSRAALFLEANVGEEMRAVLRSADPPAVARRIRNRMRGNKLAIQGLKQQFTEELFNMAKTGQFDEAGEVITSGNRLKKVFGETLPVARALGMGNSELARIKNTISTFRKAELKAAALPKGEQGIITDTPAAILDLLARWIGAQAGARTGSRMGSQLVLAQAGSSKIRGLLSSLTRDRAQQLIIESHSDPPLYAALLTRNTVPSAKQEKALRRINAWLIGVGADKDKLEEQ